MKATFEMKTLLRILTALLLVISLAQAAPNDIVMTQANATTGAAYIQAVIPGTPNSVVGTDQNGKVATLPGGGVKTIVQANTFVAGEPITVNSSGVWVPATANTTLLAANGIGIVQSTGLSLTQFTVVGSGTCTVAGAAFTPGSIYYVPLSSGIVTATAPTAVGQYVYPVGTAISATVLNVGISTPSIVTILGPTNISTIAALRALSVASFSTGQQVTVSGYYAANDGGGSVFVYNSGSATADNNGTVIAPTVGSGRWIALYTDSVNVKQFGAYGDNTHNDTAAIQAAITFAKGVPGFARTSFKVLFPFGRYLIGSINCTLTNYLELKADVGVVFYANQQGASAPVFDFTGDMGVVLTGIAVYATNPNGTAPSFYPTTGFLFAETTALGDNDFQEMNNCATSGYFTIAGCIGYQIVDGVFYHCSFGTTGATPGLILTYKNNYSIASPYATVNTATDVCADIHLFETNGSGFVLDGVAAVSFNGGNFGGDGTECVKILDTSVGISFITPQFSTSAGVSAGIFNVTSASVINGFDVINPNINNVGEPILYSGSACTVENGRIDCGAQNITMASGTLQAMTLTNQGTVTISSGIPISATSTGLNGATVANATDYSSGSWTPTLNSFTIVNGTGAITATGKYIKIGHLVWLNCLITGTGTATIASVGGTSNITGQPYNQAIAVNSGTYTNSTSGFTSASGPAVMESNALFLGTLSAQTLSSGVGLAVNFVYSE